MEKTNNRNPLEKNKGLKFILFLLQTVCVYFLANAFLFKHFPIVAIVAFVIAFIVINICPYFFKKDILIKRLRGCADGCQLLKIFLLSTASTIVTYVFGIAGKIPNIGIGFWIGNTVLAIIVEAIVFWNGIIRIYVTSEQLGIKLRLIGIICGWIPIVHLIVLGKLLRTVEREVSFENQKEYINQLRKDERVCATKYPLLMVHGVFFRDFRYLNYWGRIPKELEKNGATVFYGNHQSAASVAECGRELADRVKQIVEETGCEKVNIIAHSKGGLDCRYALSELGIEKYVASLTTINTPHRGCEFADYLLSKIPKKQQQIVANTYNATLRKLGDFAPDFLSAVYDLTADSCCKRNEILEDKADVFYQSIGSKLNVASGGRFPLNFSYQLVNYFDGANDGLVGEKSFQWGENYEFLTVKGKRGISHGDMIDLNRENIEEFDVREFYVQLVNNLKNKGF